MTAADGGGRSSTFQYLDKELAKVGLTTHNFTDWYEKYGQPDEVPSFIDDDGVWVLNHNNTVVNRLDAAHKKQSTGGVTGTTVLREMSFLPDDEFQSYSQDENEKRAMNKIVATEALRVTSLKTYKGEELRKSVDIRKEFITGHDVAEALLVCERYLRGRTWPDPDHCFFEGFLAEVGAKEVVCMRWGS